MTSGGGDMDVCLWLTLKLNKDWSSTELASLITTDTVTEIVKNFDRLDSPIKVYSHSISDFLLLIKIHRNALSTCLDENPLSLFVNERYHVINGAIA